MVRAMLDRRKTQTRRLLTPAPVWEEARSKSHGIVADGWAWKGLAAFREETFGDAAVSYTPYAVGDRLYVREAWSVRGVYSDVVEIGYRASENRSHTEYVEQIAVDKAVPGKGKWPQFPSYGPSIHMPRWASRLWLAVTDVRVQRLQDCSEGDAIAEGVERIDDPRGTAWKSYETCKDGSPHPHASVPNASPLTSYRELWESLHTAEGTTWDANPWVVAVSFEVHRGNIDAEAAHA